MASLLASLWPRSHGVRETTDGLGSDDYLVWINDTAAVLAGRDELLRFVPENVADALREKLIK